MKTMVTVVLCLVASLAHAQWVADDLRPNAIDAIGVKLVDRSENGCWTNLGEVKTYASDKLSIKGFRVVERTNGFNLAIVVESYRFGASDDCVGSIQVQVEHFTKADGLTGVHVLAEHGAVLVNHNNLNHAVIDIVSQLIAKM